MFDRNKKYIFDGGMGQALLDKGLKPEGTLWSATALIYENFHQLVVDTHLDFINAGAQLIVSNNFGVRKRRFAQNNKSDYFEIANKNAGLLAQKAKDLSNKKVLVAGSLPTHGNTYQPVFFASDEEVSDIFFETAKTLNPFVDLFYLDVMSSAKEIVIACEAIKEFDKPVLIGLYFNDNVCLTSGDTIENVAKNIKNYNCCGIIAACTSPETADLVLPEFKKTHLPYGFKLNAFENIPSDFVINEVSSTNPVKALGTRKDSDFTPSIFKTYVEKAASQGASLLGGCCEITPKHISYLNKIL